MVPVEGDTTIGFEVDPVVHEYVPPPLAVKVALVPEQIVEAPEEVTPAVTGELTVRLTVAVLEQDPFETTTVYEAAAVGETIIGLEVVPVLHE